MKKVLFICLFAIISFFVQQKNYINGSGSEVIHDIGNLFYGIPGVCVDIDC